MRPLQVPWQPQGSRISYIAAQGFESVSQSKQTLHGFSQLSLRSHITSLAVYAIDGSNHLGHRNHPWTAEVLKNLWPYFTISTSRFTCSISNLLLCNNCHKALKTMHIYYLIICLGQGSGRGLACFCTSGSPKSCHQGVAWALVISRLNWRNMHFQAHVVVAGIQFLVPQTSPSWQLALSEHGS